MKYNNINNNIRNNMHRSIFFTRSTFTIYICESTWFPIVLYTILQELELIKLFHIKKYLIFLIKISIKLKTLLF